MTTNEQQEFHRWWIDYGQHMPESQEIQAGIADREDASFDEVSAATEKMLCNITWEFAHKTKIKDSELAKKENRNW